MDERTRAKTPGFARLARDIERMVKAVCDYAAERGSHRCADDHDHDHDAITIITAMATITTAMTITTTHHDHTRPPAPQGRTLTAMTPIAVELAAPDIDSHRRSSTGIDFVHTFESGRPGPHVMVNAVTHGNEICGAIVVDRLLRMGAAAHARNAHAVVREHRGVLALRPAATVCDALRRRGLQPRLERARRSTGRATASSFAARARCARSSRPPTSSSTSTRCSSPARR